MSEKKESTEWLARLLDDFIRIPGTNKRIGLDPLLGLFPGMGDFLSSAAGLVMLAKGARRKIPAMIYVRMLSNWALNTLLGAVPFVGDLFSFWFKSNRRNYSMMKSFLEGGERRKGGGVIWPFLLLFGVAVLVFGTLIALGLFLGKVIFPSVAEKWHEIVAFLH